MTNKVNDTNSMLLVVLDLKKYRTLTDNILSHETVDPYLKNFIFLGCKFNLIGYLQINTLYDTIKIIVLPSFTNHKLRLLSKWFV